MTAQKLQLAHQQIAPAAVTLSHLRSLQPPQLSPDLQIFALACTTVLLELAYERFNNKTSGPLSHFLHGPTQIAQKHASKIGLLGPAEDILGPHHLQVTNFSKEAPGSHQGSPRSPATCAVTLPMPPPNIHNQRVSSWAMSFASLQMQPRSQVGGVQRCHEQHVGYSTQTTGAVPVFLLLRLWKGLSPLLNPTCLISH